MKSSINFKGQLIAHFSKTEKKVFGRSGNIYISYNRVSSRDQMENGNSLDWQQESMTSFAARQNLIIKKQYGWTFESAKTDERKELKKMIADIKQDTSIAGLLIYSYDRFSRSGSNGIFLLDSLRELGVKIVAVTQPVESFTATGTFQENMYMLLSKLDNDMRKDKCVAGTKSILKKGYWPYKVPFGYENKSKHQRADRHEIVISDKGYLIKQAFQWRAADKFSNQKIVELLKAKGLKITLKNLAWIFSNVFYCGYIKSSLLPGELIEGKHPSLVDELTFMKVNNLVKENSRSGIPHEFRTEQLPLKVFAADEVSGSPFTGYYVKRKNKYYYKARKTGAAVNVSATHLNKLFESLLKTFEYDKHQELLLKEKLRIKLENHFTSSVDNNKLLKARITEITNQLEMVEERFIIGEITKDQFEKFCTKYKLQQTQMTEELEANLKISSNLEKAVNKALLVAANLSQTWVRSNFNTKQHVQRLIFPEGILYNKKTDGVRTQRINTLFAEIVDFTGSLKEKPNSNLDENSYLASKVGLPGFEPRQTESKSVVLPLHHNPIDPSFVGSANVGIPVKFPKQIE